MISTGSNFSRPKTSSEIHDYNIHSLTAATGQKQNGGAGPDPLQKLNYEFDIHALILIRSTKFEKVRNLTFTSEKLKISLFLHF